MGSSTGVIWVNKMTTKTFIKTLYVGEDYTEGMRETVRDDLNRLGFYVLTGAGDSLQVYALREEDTWEEKIITFLLRITKTIIGQKNG